MSLRSNYFEYHKLRVAEGLVICGAGVVTVRGALAEVVDLLDLSEQTPIKDRGPAVAAAEIAEHVLRPHADAVRAQDPTLTQLTEREQVLGLTAIVVAGMDGGDPRAHVAWLPATGMTPFAQPIEQGGQIVSPSTVAPGDELERARGAQSEADALVELVGLHRRCVAQYKEIGVGWECAIVTGAGIERHSGRASVRPTVGRH